MTIIPFPRPAPEPHHERRAREIIVAACWEGGDSIFNPGPLEPDDDDIPSLSDSDLGWAVFREALNALGGCSLPIVLEMVAEKFRGCGLDEDEALALREFVAALTTPWHIST